MPNRKSTGADVDGFQTLHRVDNESHRPAKILGSSEKVFTELVLDQPDIHRPPSFESRTSRPEPVA